MSQYLRTTFIENNHFKLHNTNIPFKKSNKSSNLIVWQSLNSGVILIVC